MNVLLKASAAWKTVKQLFIKEDNIWKEVKEGWIKVSGVWKQFYASIFPLAPVTAYSQGYNNDGNTGTFFPEIVNRQSGTQFIGYGFPGVYVAVLDNVATVGDGGTGFTFNTYDLDSGDYATTKASMLAFMNDPSNADKIVIVAFFNFTNPSPKAGLKDAWTGGGGLQLSDKIFSTVDASVFSKPSYVAAFALAGNFFKEAVAEGDNRATNQSSQVQMDLYPDGTATVEIQTVTYS